MPEINSILQSTKKKCGYEPEFTEFDADIIDAINSALSVLTQLGVGPVSGYVIHGPEETWDDFFGEGENRLHMAKTYVFDRVRMIFDATGMSSYVLNSIKERIKEFEWRLNVAVESPKSIPKGD